MDNQTRLIEHEAGQVGKTPVILITKYENISNERQSTPLIIM